MAKRMSPAAQNAARVVPSPQAVESTDDALSRIQGQKAYFDAHPEMPKPRRDLLESKVGLHPRRIKKVNSNG